MKNITADIDTDFYDEVSNKIAWACHNIFNNRLNQDDIEHSMKLSVIVAATENIAASHIASCCERSQVNELELFAAFCNGVENKLKQISKMKKDKLQ